MKKIFTSLFITFLLTTYLSSFSTANAAEVVKISEPTHRLSNGVFIDDLLATKLLPAGDLGSLIYPPYRGVRSWQIDPATISEIVAMSNGYGISNGQTPSGQQIATDWISQFRKVSKFEKVSALSYGNPSSYWLAKIAPEKIQYINAYGKIELDLVLGKATQSPLSSNDTRQRLSKYDESIFSYAQRQIDLLSTLVDKKELDPIQLRLAQLLNPAIEKDQMTLLISDFNKLITQYRNKLKIKGTKFTITSEKEELPVTVINYFKSPVNVKLSTRVANSKIVVGEVKSIEVPGGEKRQVLLPVKALASGSSGLLAQLTNLENKPVGYPVNIALNLSVISPVTTWITSGAAILLIIAAMVQSWRRVKRKKDV